MGEMSGLELSELRHHAETMTAGLPEGEPLSRFDIALIRLGLSASVTSLDRAMIRHDIDEALAAGATSEQVQEVVSLVSGLGVHSLMVTARQIFEASLDEPDRPWPALTAEQQALWDRHVGDDAFWHGFERELPGFLAAMLRLSSDQFVAFFEYCAVPWRSGKVRGRLKELIALASDASPTHRFLPGFRLHLHNAISLGVGRRAILQALDMAGAAPAHVGTR